MERSSVNTRAIVVPTPLLAEDQDVFTSYVQNAMYPSRVSILPIVVSDLHSVSINKIRNQALQKCDTSHVLFSFPTLIPSCRASRRV